MTEPLEDATPGDHFRLLHLEDSPLDAELIAACVSRALPGCTIRLVATRADYVAALREGGFDIILADFVVPGFDGMAALALARELAPDRPFIFVSGTLGEEEAVEAVKQGATDYVVKQRLIRLPVAIARARAEMRARDGQRSAMAALRESEARLRLALEAGRLGSWELDLRGMVLQASRTCLANFGRGPEDDFTYDDLCRSVHPKDQARMREAVGRSVNDGADYDIEYRVVWPDSTVHWVHVSGRPIQAPDGTALGMAGVSLDITDRKTAEERQALLSREVDHRAKNALAVVQATLRLTKAAAVPEYVRTVEGRVAALARAQTMLAEGRWRGADLRALLEGELAPFLHAGTRLAFGGPRVMVPAAAAQPLAMALHELATNAMKYGALSTEAGGLAVSWRVEPAEHGPPMLLLRWMETGGPAILRPPARKGFGGRVLDGTIRSQLGGQVTLAWQPTGLVCEIAVPLGSESLEQAANPWGDAA